MIDSEDISRKITSLDKLKNEVLVKYFDKLELEEEIDLYENLINHFFYGDLDDVYDNKVFDNMSLKTRNEVLKIVHKYQNLCFYNTLVIGYLVLVRLQ